MKPTELKKHFFELSQRYSDTLQKDDAKCIETKACASHLITIGNLRLEIVLRTAGGSLCCPCTLYCRVYPTMGSDRFLGLCDMVYDGFVCSVFPYIETEKRLSDCFASLTGIIDKALPQVIAICENVDGVNKLLERQQNEFIRQFKLKPKHVSFDNEETKQKYLTLLCGIYETSVFLPTMTTDEAYQSFLKGKRKKAAKLLSRKKRPTDYESALLAAIADISADFEPIKDECFAQKYYKKALRWRIPMAIIVLFPLMAAFFCGMYSVICRLLSVGAAISLEMPVSYGVLLFATLPTLCASIFFYDKATAFIRPRSNMKLIEFTDITISSKLRTFCRIVFTVLMALTTMVTMLIASTALRFYPDHLTEPSQSVQMPWNDTLKYDYHNITAVYHYAGMTNAYNGNYIKKEGYLITFKDGYAVRLDGYGDINMQKAAIEYIKDYYDEITELSDAAPLL